MRMGFSFLITVSSVIRHSLMSLCEGISYITSRMISSSSALRLLELAMEAVPLDQIDFLRFNEVAREIEKIESSRATDDI
jgi:hypothetical protein